MNVGKRIDYFRKKKQWSVNYLANMAGISQSYLRSIILEEKNPTIEMIELLCNSMGISLAVFFDVESYHDPSIDTLIERWSLLSETQRTILIQLIDTMIPNNQ